jgi:hypothetical protein
MKNSLQFIAVILFGLFFSSCQKEFLDPNPKNLIIYDADAVKFIDSTGINNSTQKTAINNFVTQLKDSLLWSQFMAIYPMVGGTVATTKWNLKDPRDLDAAYRLTFYGTPVYASTGVLFSTTSDYANTHLTDNMMAASNNNSIAYYSGTQNTISGYDMGCSDSKTPWNEFGIYHAFDNTEFFGFHAHDVSPAITKGLFILSSTVSDVKRYDNGIVTGSKGSAPTTTFTNLPILIGSVSDAPSVGQRECALAAIGNGLTDAQAFTFYNIVQNFETALGR